MTVLPDLTAIDALPLDAHATATGLQAVFPGTRDTLDNDGQWWVIPFAQATSGSVYGLRLSLGEAHGAVVRCTGGHAVTVAARPADAWFAALALERLLIGPKSRGKLMNGWQSARHVLRDAVAAFGGDPDRLDDVLHLADDVPRWRADVPLDEEVARREGMARILGDPLFPVRGDEDVPPQWQRSRDSRRDDLDVACRLFEGNHGLDGPHAWAGLRPDADAAASRLRTLAARLVEADGALDEHWLPLARALAAGGDLDPRTLAPMAVGVGAEKAWEAWAAAGFWWKLLAHRVPEEHTHAARLILEAGGAEALIEARQHGR